MTVQFLESVSHGSALDLVAEVVEGLCHGEVAHAAVLVVSRQAVVAASLHVDGG